MPLFVYKISFCIFSLFFSVKAVAGEQSGAPEVSIIRPEPWGQEKSHYICCHTKSLSRCARRGSGREGCARARTSRSDVTPRSPKCPQTRRSGRRRPRHFFPPASNMFHADPSRASALSSRLYFPKPKIATCTQRYEGWLFRNLANPG